MRLALNVGDVAWYTAAWPAWLSSAIRGCRPSCAVAANKLAAFYKHVTSQSASRDVGVALGRRVPLRDLLRGRRDPRVALAMHIPADIVVHRYARLVVRNLLQIRELYRPLL